MNEVKKILGKRYYDVEFHRRWLFRSPQNIENFVVYHGDRRSDSICIAIIETNDVFLHMYSIEHDKLSGICPVVMI